MGYSVFMSTFPTSSSPLVVTIAFAACATFIACDDTPSTDAGSVGDAGASDAGSRDGGIDGGQEPLTCAQWEERIRDDVGRTLENDQICTAGLGGGCDLQTASITCADGATVTLCLGTETNREAVDLSFACEIARDSGCAIEEDCDGKECWCARGVTDPVRQVVTARALATGCVSATEVNDACTNEGQICPVDDVPGCFTDQCQTTCQAVSRAACIDGTFLEYESEFPRCTTPTSGCDAVCDPFSEVVLCHESAACADDVCSDACVVTQCDGRNFIVDVPRTDVFPCDADGGAADGGAADGGAVDGGAIDGGAADGGAADGG